jgi:transposase-like protein
MKNKYREQETFEEYDLICPYCKTKQIDLFDYELKEEGTFECQDCQKKFLYEIYLSPKYSSQSFENCYQERINTLNRILAKTENKNNARYLNLCKIDLEYYKEELRKLENNNEK